MPLGIDWARSGIWLTLALGFRVFVVKNTEKTVDDRSATAKALSKTSEVTSICLMMILPALIGYLVDRWLGTGFVFMVLGLIFGMTGAVMQLMKLVSANESSIENVDLSKVKKFEPEDDDWDSDEDESEDKWD